MFIVTAKIPQRRWFLLGALCMLVLLAALLALRDKKPERDAGNAARAATNEQRVAYLDALGWEVDAEPVEALQLTLPGDLVEPYRSYNAVQLRQGFDLTPYLGETLDRYTYRVANYPGHPRGCQADLYVYDGMIVAGDIVCTGAEGFIGTLEFPAK